MKQLDIVATFVVKPEFDAVFVAEVKKLVDASRAELGCMHYELNRDVNQPYVYVICETWASQQAIDSHNAEPHFQSFVKFIDGKIESAEIRVISPIA